MSLDGEIRAGPHYHFACGLERPPAIICGRHLIPDNEMEDLGSAPREPHDACKPSARKDGGTPARLGEFRILREVARGGMGIVYEAVQESLGRHVAIKVLPTHSLMNPNQLARFQREARAAAKLHHTNIVPVFGVGEYAGIHYFAMQFIQGQSMDS